MKLGRRMEATTMTTYARIQDEYIKNLQDKGVKRVTETSAFGQALCCLYENMGTPVHIDALKKYVGEKGVVLKGGGDSLQARHIACQLGYNMLKGDEIHPVTKVKIPKSHFALLDLENPHPSFLPKKREAAADLTDAAWDEIKKKYENMCVNCGSLEGAPMRWQKHATTVLQKGHMDPRKALACDNVIPQCAFCNQQYRDKAVFDERGFVREMLK